jgi:hypothetical protein
VKTRQNTSKHAKIRQQLSRKEAGDESREVRVENVEEKKLGRGEFSRPSYKLDSQTLRVGSRKREVGSGKWEVGSGKREVGPSDFIVVRIGSSS